MRSPSAVVALGCLAVGSLALSWPLLGPAPARPAASPPPAAVAVERLGQDSAAFVPNLGQWDQPPGFVAQFGASQAFLGAAGFRMAFLAADAAPAPLGCAPRARRLARAPRRGAAVDLAFVGATQALPVAEDRLSGTRNFFLGNDSRRWRTEVPAYGAVRYRGLYAGVDVRCYSLDGHFEYDLELAPGADLAAIAIEVTGADRMRIDPAGALVLDTAVGEVRQPAPTTYVVDSAGVRTPIRAHYTRLGATRFGFAVPNWDGQQSLVLDPGILYSAVFGGVAGVGGAIATDAHVAADGLVTVVGNTDGLVYPTTPGAFRSAAPGGGDLFVTQIDPAQPTGQQHRYSTYLGGTTGEDTPFVAVGANGVIALAAWSDSADYPTTAGAYRRTQAAGYDCVVTMLNPLFTGAAQLAYSTYIGGAAYDIPTAMALDPSGLVVLAGFTDSPDYPSTPGAFDATLGGIGNAFVSVVNPALPAAQQLAYSTYLGGSTADEAAAVAMDGFGRVIVAGRAESLDFPTTPNGFQIVHGSPIMADGFVAVLDPAQSGAQQLVYSTLFGGDADDWVDAISIDPAGRVVTLAGTTGSGNLAVSANAYRARPINGSQQYFGCFLTRLDVQAASPPQQLLYSTYLLGSNMEFTMDMEVDQIGAITLTGVTYSNDFPTTPGAYARTFTSPNTMSFVSRLDPALTPTKQLLYSTYLGVDSGAVAIAVDAADQHRVTVVGVAGPTHPTTPGAFGTPPGNNGAFVTRLELRPTGVSPYGNSTPGCDGLMAIGTRSWPQVGSAGFELTCNGVTANTVGIAILGARLPSPLPVLGVSLWVAPAGALTVLTNSDALGRAAVPLPIPAQARLAGVQLHAQFAFYVPNAAPPCPPLGWSTSDALAITVQP